MSMKEVEEEDEEEDGEERERRHEVLSCRYRSLVRMSEHWAR